jgi:hypothetical protein
MWVEEITEIRFQGFKVALEEFGERSVGHGGRLI